LTKVMLVLIADTNSEILYVLIFMLTLT
jgi:hypothetical protein